MPSKHKISIEVKKQIIQRVKQEGAKVSEIAAEHGINPKTIYRWLAKGVEAPPGILELARLKRENKSLLELVGHLTLELAKAQKKIS